MIGFLEFAGTLPVFAMLFLSAMALHLYYKQTRQAYAEAQLGVWIRMDEHLSKIKGPALTINYQKDGRLKMLSGLTSQVSPTVTHLSVNYFQAVSSRKTGSLSWMGPGEAVGLSYANRDSWAHFDLEDQVARDSPGGINFNARVESMPFILLSPKASTPIVREFLRI